MYSRFVNYPTRGRGVVVANAGLFLLSLLLDLEQRTGDAMLAVELMGRMAHGQGSGAHIQVRPVRRMWIA
jgi:hypothetical protein